MTTTVTTRVGRPMGMCAGDCGYQLVCRRVDATLGPSQRRHKGRRLCTVCYDYRRQRGQLENYPRVSRRLVDVIAAYNDLIVVGVRSRGELAARIGVSTSALERALRRARSYDMFIES